MSIERSSTELLSKNFIKRVLRYCIAIGCLLYAVPESRGAGSDFFTPSITVNQEYNDNILETPNNKKGDFVTRVMPGFAMAYRAPFWDWDLGYIFDYRHYSKGTRDDEITHNVNAKGNLRLIDNLLYLDLSDTYSRVSLDTLRDTTTESLSVNQTDQNILSVSPYLLLHPANNNTVKTGLRYSKTSYFGSEGSSEGIDYQEFGAFISMNHELSSKCTLIFNGNYSYDVTSENINYSRVTPSVGIRYDYTEKSFISLEGGYTALFNSGRTDTSPYWNAAFTHTFDFMILSVNSGITYNTDPLQYASKQTTVGARLDKPFQRGATSLFISYSNIKDSLQNTLKYINYDRGTSTKYEAGTSTKYDFTSQIAGHLDLIADKFSGNNGYDTTFSGLNYPYRFSLGPGISMALKNKFTISLDYNYVTYRNSPASASGSTDINRVIVGLSKAF